MEGVDGVNATEVDAGWNDGVVLAASSLLFLFGGS
jgi:hypothetical protein